MENRRKCTPALLCDIYSKEQMKPIRSRIIKQNADFQEGIFNLRVLPHLCLSQNFDH